MFGKIPPLLLVLLLLPVAPSLAQQSPTAPNDKLVRVLRTSNKAQANRFVCEAFKIDNTNPYNIINFFWAVTSREEGGIFSFAHPEEERGYIVAVCPEYQLPTLRTLAQNIDRPRINSAPGSKYIYHRLKYRNAADPNLLNPAAFYLGPGSVLISDVETNAIQIFDAPNGAEVMQQAFEEILDKPLPQVELQVKVYEIRVNNDGQLGLDYLAWKNGPGRLLGGLRATGEQINIAVFGDESNSGRGAGAYVNYPSAFFDFLAEKGKAAVHIDSKITTLNKVQAKLRTGEQIRFYRTVITGVGGGQQRTLESAAQALETEALTLSVSQGEGDLPGVEILDAVDTGVELLVEPIISEEEIDIDVTMQVVSHLGFDGKGEPLLSSRKVRQAISVADGQEVLFGGLMRERRVESTEKVPIFGSLPIIGYLFGGETTINQKSIVVTSITPRIVEAGQNLTAGDEMIKRRELGEEVVVMPRAEFGFQQSFEQIF